MAKKNSIKDDPLYRVMDMGMELAGRFYSKYRGFVIDNDDPLKLNRLLLVVPVLNALETDGIWAFPSTIWGGKDYGVQLLPQKGDMVWVEYEMGDPEHPIWHHAGYAADELPKEFETPNHYGFKTPLGSIILINDNEDAEEVLVKLSTKKEWIKINKDNLELESKLIKLGKDGDEAGVLGDTLKEKLDELTEQVSDLTNILATHTHAGPAGPPIKAAQIAAIKIKVDLVKTEFTKFLSKKVKIDK